MLGDGEAEELMVGLPVLDALAHWEGDSDDATEREAVGDVDEKKEAEVELDAMEVVEGVALGSAEKLAAAVGEGLVEAQAETLPLREGDELCVVLGLGLGVSLCMLLYVTGALAEEESEAEGLAVVEWEAEAQGDGLWLAERDGSGVVEELGVLDKEGDPVALPLAQPEADALGDWLWEVVAVNDPVTDGECEVDWEPDGVPLPLTVREGLRVAEGEDVDEAVKRPLSEGLGVAEEQGLLVIVGVSEAQPEGLGEVVCEGESVPDLVLEEQALAVPERLPLPDDEAELVTLREGAEEPLGEMVGEEDWSAEAVLEALGQGEGDTVELVESEALEEWLGVPDWEAHADTVTDTLGLTVAHDDAEGDALKDEETLGEREPEAEEQNEAEDECVTDAVPQGVEEED